MTEGRIGHLAARLLEAPRERWALEFDGLRIEDQQAVGAAMRERAEVNRRELATSEQHIAEEERDLAQKQASASVDSETADWHLDGILGSRQLIAHRQEILERIERWLAVCG